MSWNLLPELMIEFRLFWLTFTNKLHVKKLMVVFFLKFSFQQ